jgi:8-oxo-dGTP diphosphatase
VTARSLRLLGLARANEHDLASRAPLTHAVTVVRHGGATLLVFNRKKQHWELPGGHIDAGEAPRDCAVRELFEESGAVCDPAKLHFAGIITVAASDDAKATQEYGALYVVEVEARPPFAPNDEIAAVRWWDGAERIADLAAVDRQLVELVA